ncbi:COX15/CtaA family protein [Novosphingobium sp. B 225]|uniref:COX15/CtaA family protein n=1 Tax=Novosphingobium sp. B 225 TaxID=1961849 RepID=UPI000B4AB66D|nr:COX15/CtaA family protein [Novosphingobium sp. B 225]
MAIDQSGPAPRPLAIARWLFMVAAMIVLIVAVGGITRLTESGVSITEWKPVSGTLPPLSEAAWQAEFDAYRQTPQYIQINGPAGMTLATYKTIFFWEWFHRLIARSIGLAFALPLAWFWAKRAIPEGYKLRLLVLLAMGGLQGAVGWWMVKSGISTDVRVSHFRLATHLMLALITMAAIIWTALDLRALAQGKSRARLTAFGAAALGVLGIQLVLGALVAGLRAGYVAGAGWFSWEAWPLMQGRLIPAGIDWIDGALHAALNDPFLVHFLHRWWAWLAVAMLVVLARQVRQPRRAASIAIHSTFGTQIVLGIAAIWSGMELWLAVAHQLNGALTLAAAVWGTHVLGRIKG